MGQALCFFFHYLFYIDISNVERSTCNAVKWFIKCVMEKAKHKVTNQISREILIAVAIF